jgi:hypothetical protein
MSEPIERWELALVLDSVVRFYHPTHGYYARDWVAGEFDTPKKQRQEARRVVCQLLAEGWEPLSFGDMPGGQGEGFLFRRKLLPGE